MDPGKLVDELNVVAQYLDNQHSLGRDVTVAKKAQVQSFLLKIKNLKRCDMHHATKVSDAISHGPWSNDEKYELGNALESRVSDQPVASTKAREGQTCNYENYMTPSDLAYLESSASLQMKVRRIVWRAKMVGLDTPSEKTKGRMTAILAYKGLGNSNPTETTLHELLQEINHAYAQDKGSRSPYMHITDYPLTPDGLPQDMFDGAYNEESFIVCNYLDKIEPMVRKKFLRGSAMPLKSQPGTTLAVPGGMHNFGNGSMAQAIAMTVAQTIAQCMQQHASGSSADAGITMCGNAGTGNLHAPSLEQFRPRGTGQLMLQGEIPAMADIASSPRAGPAAATAVEPTAAPAPANQAPASAPAPAPNPIDALAEMRKEMEAAKAEAARLRNERTANKKKSKGGKKQKTIQKIKKARER